MYSIIIDVEQRKLFYDPNVNWYTGQNYPTKEKYFFGKCLLTPNKFVSVGEILCQIRSTINVVVDSEEFKKFVKGLTFHKSAN